MFKIGDKVRCINEGGSLNFKIKIGEIYTVSEIINSRYNRDILLRLREAPLDCAWYDTRFEFVIENKPIKKGWGF